ncbi:MAG: hypothetical protein ACJ8OJ_00140 [Povalibacter sp.]
MNSSDEFEIDDLSEIEVELTAQDLLDLSPLSIAKPAISAVPAQPVATVSASAIVQATAIAPSAKATAVSAPHAKPKNSGGFGVVVGTVLAVGIVAAGMTAVLSKESSARKQPLKIAQSTIPDKPDPVIEEEPELPPVLVKNPFDESEVFALPAGTTKAEAREYVADVLLKRAAERQAMLEPHSTH